MLKRFILLCLVLSMLITCCAPVLATESEDYEDYEDYYLSQSNEELIRWINSAERGTFEYWKAWYPFLRAARDLNEILTVQSTSEEYSLTEIHVTSVRYNTQYYFEKGNEKLMVCIGLPGTADDPKPSLPERMEEINRELSLEYEQLQYTAASVTLDGVETPVYYCDGGAYLKKGSDETELWAPTAHFDWMGRPVIISGVGDLYGSEWDHAYFDLFKFDITSLTPIGVERVDITEKFEDEAFRSFVYDAILKTPGTPIYDTDVSHIRQFEVSNSDDLPPVENLAGLEYFTKLERLSISNCQITELDVNMLKQLKHLSVHSCIGLESINISGLEHFEGLSCFDNKLTELNLSCPELIYIACMNNQLSELDLSGCPALEELLCGRNNLKTLDITPCPELRMLSCRNNLFEDTSAIIGYNERIWLNPSYELYFYPQKSEASDELPLQDVAETDWFYDAVQYTFSRGLMKGVSDDRFAPQDEVSRAMTATVLYRLAGAQEAEGSNPFPDVEAGQWYSDAVIWAADEKIVEGYGNGSFGTNDPVTREQLVAMLWRYQGKPSGEAGALKAFSDAAKISAWAEDAFIWAVDAGIIQGKTGGILDPQGTITRAEVAQILMNYDLINT